MQANCPQCGQSITVDDARVPDRAFGVRCPKCQTTVRFPGRAPAAAPAAAAPAPAPARPETASPLPPLPVEPPRGAEPPARDDVRAQVMAQIRREMHAGEGLGRALVSLPNSNLAAAVALLLSRQGFSVDTHDDTAEAVRLLDQGVYAAVATARLAGATPKAESLYQRINRLGADARRRVFLLLVGDEFRSGDGTQAFVALADLVLHTSDAGQADAPLRHAWDDRQRLYQAYLDARRRFEATAS